MNPFRDKSVERTFERYPPKVRQRLLDLRALIFETAAETDGVGELEETLKWGEPAYLTSQSRSGSTVRIGWKESKPSQYAMYFICTTNLVETFQTLFPNEFNLEDNRAIVFDEDDVAPTDKLSGCIAAALTYHSSKKAKPTRLPLA